MRSEARYSSTRMRRGHGGGISRKITGKITGKVIGKIMRSAMVSFFVATTALIVSAATPGVASANQTDWSPPLNVDGSSELVSVSCASPLFCVAGDNGGAVLTYNGSLWSAPNQITEGGDLNVSCPTTTFCVAVGGGGGENTWNGSTWNGPGPVGSEFAT